jgi:uncharacterized protein (TIGR04255 family)
MTQKRLYSNNPIAEALLDVQFDSNTALDQLKGFSKKLGSEFATINERHLVQTTFQLTEGKPIQAQNISIEGYDFWNNQKTEVIQARKNGFAFSRLKPYESWEKHYPEAVNYLKEYQKSFGENPAKRVAVRFINLIKIPNTKVELNNYFNCAPDTPKGIASDLTSFLYRVVIACEPSINANITIAPSNQVAIGSTADFLLDIDVYATYPVPISGDLSNVFDKLHGYAENIFEAYVTDLTRELIK